MWRWWRRMSAHRCSDCGINWPLSFKRCAQCEGTLDRVNESQAMPLSEARSLANHLEFERLYGKGEGDFGRETAEERDARRARAAAAEGIGLNH